MGEQLDVTVPVPATITFYQVQQINLLWDQALIRIQLTSSTGAVVNVEYSGVNATALMTALNSANLATKSLQRRVLEKLVLDGKIAAGTVSGVAQ